MEDSLLNLLISEIKSKSQIKDLDSHYIQDKLEKYFKTYGNIRKKLEIEYEKKQNTITKSKTFKEIIKQIKKEIGEVYGQFLTSSFTKKEKILKNLTSIEQSEKLLFLHKSTRERIEFYTQIYSKIFTWYRPKQIADIACGLNPCSYFHIKQVLKNQPKYFATDLNKSDMDFLNNYFKKFNIDGIAKNYDVTKLDFLEDKNYKNSDLVFFLKALDSFEKIEKNISKKILTKTPASHIVVSFPTQSIKSKDNFKVKRTWLIKFIEDRGWNLEQFVVENELFFLIKK